jgi:hypothetical protein
VCNKTSRHACCEHQTERSEVRRSATAELAAVLARAAKKILPEAQRGVEIFLSRLSCPCKHVFVKQRERLTNTFLPALFLCNSLKNTFLAKAMVQFVQLLCNYCAICAI